MSETDPYAAPEHEVARFDTSTPGETEVDTPAVATVVPPVVEEESVPEGSIKNVLAWVGDDRTKAQAALDAENAADEPRTTLVAKLEDILA